jgi:hypothetical protein
MSRSPSKFEWPHEVIWGDFPFFHGARNMCTKFFPNLACWFVHNRHLVLKGKIKPTICERYWLLNLALKFWLLNFGSYIWATHGTASQNKQCQPNKKSYMLGVCRFYMLIGSNNIVPPSTSRYLSLHIDCHLVDPKPSRLSGGDPFWVAWTFTG